MRILVALSSAEYLRYYDSAIVELADRGHHVILAVNAVREGKFVSLDALADAHARVSVAGLVPPRGDRWARFAAGLRGTMDFVRYLHPQLSGAAVLRARMKRQVLPAWLRWADRIRSMPPAVVRRVMNALAGLEAVVPVSRALADFVDRHRPDMVIVSPVIEGASEQVDLVRAARARGIPVAACIASWDNLTNKGDLRVAVDRVVVWNDAQKREATELHRVPPECVAVTGAQLFDRWFARTPGRSRDEFCRTVGLRSSKPFVLFVGSSVFIARAEAEVPFVRRWIEALRQSSDPAVRDLAVLLRPHPYSGAAWADADWSAFPDVAVWPKGRYNPVDEDTRAGFFDSMHYSEAVVGINTSAMIEAAIVGRPVFSILAPEFSGSQEGTLHFHHLLPQNGGFLRVAASLEEHVAQVAEVRRNPNAAREELAGFVRSFIRPHGVDRPCTPILADTLEQLGRAPAPEAARDTILARVLRLLFYPLALLAALVPEETPRKKRASTWVRERWRRRARAWQRGAKSVRSSKPRSAAPARSAMAAALVLCVIVPSLVGTLLVLGFAISELAGRTPFAYERPVNIAEAAGMGLSSEVLRYLRAGESPHAVLHVRPHIISSEITRVTAVEAAVWSRRLRLMRLLEREGALDDPALRASLSCLAADIQAAEIQQFISASSTLAQCEPGARARSIAARSN